MALQGSSLLLSYFHIKVHVKINIFLCLTTMVLHKKIRYRSQRYFSSFFNDDLLCELIFTVFRSCLNTQNKESICVQLLKLYFTPFLLAMYKKTPCVDHMLFLCKYCLLANLKGRAYRVVIICTWMSVSVGVEVAEMMQSLQS